MDTFHLFEDAANAYAAELETEEEITTADEYYDLEQKFYLKSMRMLNCTIEKLSQYPLTSESSANSVAAMSQVLNMPKLEVELFHRFMSIFKQVIEPVIPDATLQLTHLLCRTTGEAHDSITSVDPADPECYTHLGKKYKVF